MSTSEDNLVHQEYEVITDHSENNPGSSDEKKESDEKDETDEKSDTPVETKEETSVDSDEKKIQESLEDIKKFGNVVKGLVGGFMKEFIPKMSEARTNIKDILSTVLDQVEKEKSADTDDQSTASDDLEQLVKEIEEEFKSIKERTTMNINVSQDEQTEEQEEQDDEEQEEYEDDGEEQEEQDGEEYEDDGEEQDDTFWKMYDDRCKFVVSQDNTPIGYFDEFRKAQKYMNKIYNQFVSSRLGHFLRTERSVDTIKVYTKTPYLWFIYAEQLCFDVTIDTVYRFKAE